MATGPDDTLVNELALLLVQLASSGPELRVASEVVIDDPTEKWTAAPVELDDEHADLLAASQESDEEDADVSESVVPMILRKVRRAAQDLKILVQENQDIKTMC